MASDAKDKDKAATESSTAEFWKEKVNRWTRVIDGLEAEIRAMRARGEDFADATGADLERIVALATDLPALMERARSVPYALQRITHSLVERVRARCIGPGAYEVFLEFPGGESMGRFFRAGPFQCSQPERVWSFHRLAEDADAAEIGREILRMSGANKMAKWGPGTVLAAAAIHEHVEEEAERDGEHWTVAELAERTGECEADVARAGIRGALGPARWKKGDGLVFRPTTEDLHRALPDHALRDVARAHGLDPADLVAIWVVTRANQPWKKAPRKDELERMEDSVGRVYVRRSQCERLGLSTEVDLESAAEETRRALAEAVLRDYGRELDPAEFVWWQVLRDRWAGRFDFVDLLRIEKAIKRGHVRSVLVRGALLDGRRQRALLYVHVPRDVLETEDPAVVARWLWKDGIPPSGTYGRTGGIRRARKKNPRAARTGKQ